MDLRPSRPAAASALRRGDLLPRLRSPLPGPRARRLARALAGVEAPGVNTLSADVPILWQEALGANVLDVDGNRYLDLTSGFGAALVGHRHPRVVAAVKRQASRLLHGLGDVHAHPARVALASDLVRRAPLPDPRVYFAVSGADAVEVALKTAVLATGRPGILAFDGAYHGLTLGALAVTSRSAFREPFRAHLHRHARHLPYGAPATRLETVLGAGNVGCVIVEPIQGREGVRLPADGWLAELAALCRRHGALLVADEILTGCYRTGPFSAAEAAGAVPDLLICGKALAGGLPLAVVIGEHRHLAAWPEHGEALHTGTFLAHPLSCAAALAVLELLDGELAGAAERLGHDLEAALAPLASDPAVRGIRGRGALWGIDLATAGAASRCTAEALRRGLLVLPAGADGSVLELLPPLTITPRQVAAAVALLRDSIAAATG